MYKYFMKKSNLILTLFISSLFISTSLDAAVFDLNILKNNQKRDLLIASPGGHGGGGGGGKKPKDKKEECIKRSKRAIGFFERQLFDEERLGKSTEKTEKKIKEYKQILLKCSGRKIKDGEIKEGEKKECEIKESEIKALSKLDDLGNTIFSSLIKNETIEIIKKADRDTRTRISCEIKKLKDEAKNIDTSDIDYWLKKAGEYQLKIEALEEFQRKIEVFLNKSIDSMVYALKFFDVRDIKITDDDKSELVQKLTNYLNVSIEVGDGDLFVSEEGEYDEEFWKPIDDLSELTTRVLQMGLSYENTDLNLDPSGSL